MKILTINNKKEEKFLRKKTVRFDFDKYRKKETSELIKKMREIMTEANGIGLSANQLGLNMRLFIAQIPKIQYQEVEPPKINYQDNKQKDADSKFYAIFNPEITKFSEKKIVIEEGCLSVPGIYGEVERPEKITLVGYDKNAKKIKIKAWGLLARVFQHEVDHLNGILFIDRCKNVYAIEKSKIQNKKL